MTESPGNTLKENSSHHDVKSAENPPNGNPPNGIPNGNSSSGNRNHSKTRALLGFTCFLILLGVAWYCLWVLYLQYYESTDDAYANGNFINVNSAISGSVIAYFADDTDLVKEGQLIVSLDPTNYASIYQKELASLSSAVLQVRQLYDNVKMERALVKIKQTELDRTKFDYYNRLEILKTLPEAVSREDFFHSEQNFLSAKFELLRAESQLMTALSAVGNAPIDQHPLIENQKENIRIAYYHLQHCSIYAPQTGYVAQRAVEVGQWVTPTTNLMAIIPTDYVWVDANFKETQLSKMRIGQPTTVWFDLYGSKIKYDGKVIGIASGTGSVFSLIPPQNATGNWIKIVQRLPVRISLDPEATKRFPVRLGISAEVEVDVTDQSLPLLSAHPPEHPVAETRIFDIHMDKVDLIIDKIIQENLLSKYPEVQETMNDNASV